MNTALENESGPPIALDLNFGPRAAAPPAIAVPLPAAPPAEPPAEPTGKQDFWERVLVSVSTQSWLASMAFHMALMIVLALVLGTIHAASTLGKGQMFEAAEVDAAAEPISHFEIGNTPIEPTDLTTETLTQIQPPTVEAQYNDNSPEFEPAGGGVAAGTTTFGGTGGFTNALGIGPSLNKSGVDTSMGLGVNAGTGGAGSGFGFRGKGMRDGVLGGATAQSERAVAGALNWIARHQNRDGSWSLLYTKNCKGSHCSCPGERTDDSGATALALLPFLAAGQTHQSKGSPYEKKIGDGINWLIRHQKKNGDLSTGDSQMYEHGLAAIALCEAYGMTQDSRIGYAAQDAINFIESAQNKEGGWRYTHGTDDSDTSVFGWQVMALKSGQMAGLKVSPNVLTACKKYLGSCSRGEYKSEFSYTPGGRSTISMTAVGLLTSQYLGARRGDPVVSVGLDFLMQYKPVVKERNTYYWYYATQAMHNVPGPEWDEWNRHMRRILIETQEKTTGCANGSWNPNEPEPDPWGNQGGRLMVTSFCTLTLEVYYRYLPLYQLDEAAKKALTKVD